MSKDTKGGDIPPSYNNNQDPTIQNLQFENEKLKTILQSLLVQVLAQQEQDTADGHPERKHARLFRLNEDVTDPTFQRSLSNPITQEDIQLLSQNYLQTHGSHNSTNNNSNGQDFIASNVDYDYLATIANELQLQLQSNTTPTTTTTTTTTTTNNINPITLSAAPTTLTRTTQLTGPNDQQRVLEVPGINPRENHLVTELPSITSVQNNYYNSQSTSITIVTQREEVTVTHPLDNIYSEVQHHSLENEGNINIHQPNVNRMIWQEALILDVPQSDFWVIVPHEFDQEERQQLHDTILLEDSTNYYDLCREEYDSKFHEFGTHVPSLISTDDDNDGYILLETERVQQSLVNYISTIVASLPTIGQFAERELLDALTSALSLQEATLEQHYNLQNGPSTTSTASSTTTSTTNQATKPHDKTIPQSNPNGPLSPKEIISTAQFITDAVTTGKIDPQKAMQHLQRLLPQKVTTTASWLSWLYDWSTWSYSLFSYGTTAYSLYRNPIVSTTILTWVYKGVTYALLFLI